jgi:predicted hydrocarbon binding protein
MFHKKLIKIIIIVIIIIFIVLPLYKGDSVSSVINNIGNTINAVKDNTPNWAKELVGKVFSISIRLIKVMFNAIVDIIFEEAGREVDKKLEEKKDEIDNAYNTFLNNNDILLPQN